MSVICRGTSIFCFQNIRNDLIYVNIWFVDVYIGEIIFKDYTDHLRQRLAHITLYKNPYFKNSIFSLLDGQPS